MMNRLCMLITLWMFPLVIGAQDKVPEERCHQFLKGVPVNCMKSNDVNMLWVGTNAGLYIFNYFEGVRTILEDGAVTALAEDDGGYMWCALQGGKVVRVDKEKEFEIAEKVKIESMQIQGSQIWIGTASGGVYVWNIKTLNEIAHYQKSNSELLSDKINFIHKDVENTMWIGTDEGLSSVSGNSWSSHMASKDITAVAEGHGQLWFAGEGYLWTSPDSKDWESVRVSRRLIQGKVIGMSFDDNARLYLASDIFARYDAEDRSTFLYNGDFGFKERNMLCVGKDKDGDMWVGTLENGLYRFKVFFVDPPEEPLSAMAYSEKVLDCPDHTNGVVGVDVSGGKKPYDIQWDCEDCWGYRIEGVTTGEYTVTVTDADGNTAISSAVVSSYLPININLERLKSISRDGARDGEIIIKADGGKGRLTYHWSDNRRTPMRRSLRMGEYEVTVTDERGCKANRKFIVSEPRIIPELEPSMLVEGQVITIKELFFPADSLNFTDESLPALEEIKEFLTGNDHISIEIGGHTNGLPNHDYCDWLSAGRAKKVAEYFYALSIQPDQLTFKGYGKRNPIASNDSASGRSKNQRVEIKILKIRNQ